MFWKVKGAKAFYNITNRYHLKKSTIFYVRLYGIAKPIKHTLTIHYEKRIRKQEQIIMRV